MQLHTKIRLVDHAFHVEVGIPSGPVEDAFTASEWEAVSAIGEPSISVGGEFTDGASLTFELPLEQVKFPSQFPIKQIFDTDDHLDAADRATLYKDEISTRIDAAITAIKNTNNTYVADVIDEVRTINTSD